MASKRQAESRLLRLLAICAGCLWLAIVLVDAFNTIVLARRTERAFRLTRFFYRLTWRIHSLIARRIQSGRGREDFLSIFGPLSLLALMACWGASLVLSFALLQWAAGLDISGASHTFAHAVYFSGAALVTVAPSEPLNRASRFLMVVEAGLGISMLGLVVGYLPVLYQSFSSRELHISMLDARAGSPPTAAVLLARQAVNPNKLESDLERWEEWAAEILEGHLSYPMLGYFRSQHPNQSWLSALTAILDASAMVMVCSTESLNRQATLTFAMGRHALVDLARIFGRPPRPDGREVLQHAGAEHVIRDLRAARVALDLDRFSLGELHKLLAMYQPYANALSHHFLIALPGWLPDGAQRENWRATAWNRSDQQFTVSDPFQEQPD